MSRISRSLFWRAMPTSRAIFGATSPAAPPEISVSEPAIEVSGAERGFGIDLGLQDTIDREQAALDEELSFVE